MCGSSYQPMIRSGPVPRFAARAAFGRTSSQVMYSTLTGTPVASVNFLVLAFQSSSSDLTNPDQRKSRSDAPLSGLNIEAAFSPWPKARLAARPRPKPSTVRLGILRMTPLREGWRAHHRALRSACEAAAAQARNALASAVAMTTLLPSVRANDAGICEGEMPVSADAMTS